MPVDIPGNIRANMLQIPRVSDLKRNRLAMENIQTQNMLARDANTRANAAETRTQSIFDTEEGQRKVRMIYEGAQVALQNPAATPAFIQSLKDMGELDPNFSGEVSENELNIIAKGAAAKLGGNPLGMSQIANPDIPSNVRSYLAYSGLDSNQRTDFENANRSRQVIETGGGTAVLGPTGANVIEGAEAEALRTRASGDAAATASAETGARNLQNSLNTQIDDGFAAADALPVINRSIELLEEGTRTGGFNSVSLWAANRLGITGADEGELSANLGKAVLSQLRTTFGAQFTEREGARLQEIEAGFGKSVDVNLRLMRQAKAIAERAARRGITAARRAGRPEDADLIEEAMSVRLDYETSLLPDGVTEEDIKHTMQIHNLTRDQVLERLNAP